MLDLVPFMQFKKRGKHPWKSAPFSKLKVTLLQSKLKVTLLDGHFTCFLNGTNGAKLRKASHISLHKK